MIELDPFYNATCTDRDKLLSLIEEGDADIILSEKNSDGFNELMKHELIHIVDGKVCLTERGKQAREIGVSTVINQLKPIPVIPDILPVPTKRKRTIYFIAFSFLLLLVLTYFLLWKI